MASAVRLIENVDIARIFEEVADLLDLQGANQFRVRAYRTAARTVGCMRYGVNQARRGWCEAQDVANTRHWAEFQKLITR
jgi:hypothetical protein